MVMASLPYVTSPGNIVKALTGIKAATVPDRVSQDFVKTILKIPGGSGDQMTAFLKKLGLTNPDGSPNETYRKFRNPTSSGSAIALAIHTAYAPLYVRNEFMHELSDADLVGLIVEETGEAHDSNTVKLTANCIKHLKQFANFNSKVEHDVPATVKPDEALREGSEESRERPSSKAFGINLGYTINLNLPATADPNVFDAIFKSLKEHLLSSQDG
jgi:hypothetical protein